ncbi:MAG: ribosome-associated translation inhibitor RaiA [Thermoleophilia bacterium]|nr:ribosome-associated translation inhibitor RaiA [Thermoleophilia bacterium]
MNLQVKGRNIAITDALRVYVDEKLTKLGKNLNSASTMEVELFVEKNPSIADNQVAEVTIFTKGPVLRAKEASADMYASIDLVADKLSRQVKKYRGKLVSHNAHVRGSIPPDAIMPLPEEAEEQEEGPEIVKLKSFDIKPMSAEEAALQLELIGHDFFVFRNSETNDTSVIYRRRDGNYGLIEPK